MIRINGISPISELASISVEENELITGAKKIIDSDHAYIHQGKYFTAAFLLTIATGATNKVTFKTNSAKEIHYRPANVVSSADKLTFNFYEGSSVDSEGSAVTPTNRSRKLATATDVVVKTGVTVGTNGTQISTAYIPGTTGIGGVRSGQQLSGNNEWVLKANTLYTIEFINGSSDTNSVFVELQWYEE